MGLTHTSTGIHAADPCLQIRKMTPASRVIALAGNPNVGKSTLFNSLTGGHQHTGNWPGKTVSNAQGFFSSDRHSYTLVDIPGTYSLLAHSAEEEVARNFLCFGDHDGVVVVCDATCLERNLNLVLQVIEAADHVLVCVNLMDEAKRRHISIDLAKLSSLLGVPTAQSQARCKKTLGQLKSRLDDMMDQASPAPCPVTYCPPAEDAISLVQKTLLPFLGEAHIKMPGSRWLAIRLLEGDPVLLEELSARLGRDLSQEPEVAEGLQNAEAALKKAGLSRQKFKDSIVEGLVEQAEWIAGECVSFNRAGYDRRDRKLDQIFTSRLTGYPIMAGLLALVFWLTITGANYPSALLSDLLFRLQGFLSHMLLYAGTPGWLHDLLILGVYQVLAWVVAVMLPPMAIFFPLFTLLEDSGYLPRVAYNLDCPFKKCCACGKQGLTMCMGFGCNAAGIVGCRIIDSPRERLIAMITNSFVPCNGRFPTLITLISIFFLTTASGLKASLLSTLILTLFVLLGIGMTFLVSKALSVTVLKGVPSSFTLELPSYRRPQIGRVILRSVLDRTLFVLGRAAAVAAPAGLVIWLMANVTVGDVSLLALCASFLDPFARLLGLDGVILMAFILGLPANEIVLPIILMAYTANGSLAEPGSLSAIGQLLTANGWTWVTAVCTMLFSLMHWPCSTTLLTIKKESGSWKWTWLSLIIPTICGMVLCFCVNLTAALLL
ncbi:MAG: ferrous iron transport protein B [Clostridiales bacterium]|nr:ferrous iron transport protein B [Clostridiales bacterium]